MLRGLAAVLGLLFVYVLGFAAQRTVHHCHGTTVAAETPACCRAVKAEAASGCCAEGRCRCASRRESSEPPHRGETTLGSGGCDFGCCVALDVSVPTGPLPEAYELDVQLPALALSVPIAATLPSKECAYVVPLATGPPRPDPRLARQRTTVLLI